MLVKAFGVSRYLLWCPLTFLIRSYLLGQGCPCPDCGSEDVVKDGYNRRKTMPDIQMLECKECGRNFCVRAETIFYWKHASIGELFINSWVFFGGGSKEWTRKWICDVGKYCSLEWFERLEKAFMKHAGDASNFLNGFFQADEMQIRSFGEKPLILGVKRCDGKIFETVLRGHSAFEFASALRKADEGIGPIVDLVHVSHRPQTRAHKQPGGEDTQRTRRAEKNNRNAQKRERNENSRDDHDDAIDVEAKKSRPQR